MRQFEKMPYHMVRKFLLHQISLSTSSISFMRIISILGTITIGVIWIYGYINGENLIDSVSILLLACAIVILVPNFIIFVSKKLVKTLTAELERLEDGLETNTKAELKRLHRRNLIIAFCILGLSIGILVAALSFFRLI